METLSIEHQKPFNGYCIILGSYRTYWHYGTSGGLKYGQLGYFYGKGISHLGIIEGIQTLEEAITKFIEIINESKNANT